MTIEDVAGRLSEEDARRLTDEVRRDGAALWEKVLDLFEGEAHIALGYENFEGYWAAEFGGSGTRGTQLTLAGRVTRVLREASLPAPANDTIARAMSPMLRSNPEKIPEVWKAALEASDGRPIGSQVKQLVSPYKRQAPLSRVDGRNTRKLRNGVGKPLRDIRGQLALVDGSIDDALSTFPPDTLVRDWISSATAARDRLDKLIERLGKIER